MNYNAECMCVYDQYMHSQRNCYIRHTHNVSAIIVEESVLAKGVVWEQQYHTHTTTQRHSIFFLFLSNQKVLRFIAVENKQFASNDYSYLCVLFICKCSVNM